MHGLDRLSPDEVFEFGMEAIDAVSDFLADKPHFMGDEPTSLDASASGILVNIVGCPIKSSADDYTSAKKKDQRLLQRSATGVLSGIIRAEATGLTHIADSVSVIRLGWRRQPGRIWESWVTEYRDSPYEYEGSTDQFQSLLDPLYPVFQAVQAFVGNGNIGVQQGHIAPHTGNMLFDLADTLLEVAQGCLHSVDASPQSSQMFEYQIFNVVGHAGFPIVGSSTSVP